MSILLTGTSNPDLAKRISEQLQIPLAKRICERFYSTETRIKIMENMRNKDVFIVQTGGAHENFSVNDAVQETILLIDAARLASAKTITVVFALYPYARQDKKSGSREPISARVVARQIESVGANRVICVDLHAAQIQGFFNIPVDNLYSFNYLVQYLKGDVYPIDTNFAIINNSEHYIACAPDAGMSKNIGRYASALGIRRVIMNKDRDVNEKSVVNSVELIGDKEHVAGKTVIIIDDMFDTCGTLIAAAEAIVKEYGARSVIAAAAHGILSGPAIQRLNDCPYIERVVVTNTLDQTENQKNCSKIHVVDISGLLGAAIKCLITGSSISDLFEPGIVNGYNVIPAPQDSTEKPCPTEKPADVKMNNYDAAREKLDELFDYMGRKFPEVRADIGLVEQEVSDDGLQVLINVHTRKNKFPCDHQKAWRAALENNGYTFWNKDITTTESGYTLRLNLCSPDVADKDLLLKYLDRYTIRSSTGTPYGNIDIMKDLFGNKALYTHCTDDDYSGHILHIYLFVEGELKGKACTIDDYFGSCSECDEYCGVSADDLLARVEKQITDSACVYNKLDDIHKKLPKKVYSDLRNDIDNFDDQLVRKIAKLKEMFTRSIHREYNVQCFKTLVDPNLLEYLDFSGLEKRIDDPDNMEEEMDELIRDSEYVFSVCKMDDMSDIKHAYLLTEGKYVGKVLFIEDYWHDDERHDNVADHVKSLLVDKASTRLFDSLEDFKAYGETELYEGLRLKSNAK